jgi:hypothetical protein
VAKLRPWCRRMTLRIAVNRFSACRNRTDIGPGLLPLPSVGDTFSRFLPVFPETFP